MLCVLRFPSITWNVGHEKVIFTNVPSCSIMYMEAVMVSIMCSTRDGIALKDLVPFQGTLKVREQSDISELRDSILREGLLMPFAVWKHDGKDFLLDGHGRLEALLQLAVDDMSIMEAAFPVVYVNADTEEEARKALLQITSSYGKITKKGVTEFTAKIPGYVAPSIKKFVSRPACVVKVPAASDRQVIRISVPKEKAADVRGVLASIGYIEVL